MAFHFLIDEYPNAIRLSDDVEYRIVTDFKQILTIIQLIEEEPLFIDAEKTQMIIGSFYLDSIPTNMIKEAQKELLNFFQMYEEKEDTLDESRGVKIFDYQKDSGKVYAAFLQQYGMDLRKTDMHWFEFSNLLNNLNDGKPNLVEVLQIRSMTEQDMKDLSPSTKSHYRKLKRRFSLDKKKEQEVQKASVFDTLVNTFKKGR